MPMTRHSVWAFFAIVVVAAVLNAQQASRDSVRLEPGTPLIDGRVIRSHVSTQRSTLPGRPANEVVTSLTMRDSAGQRFMTMATRGAIPSDSGPVQYELVQTYDARALTLVSYLLAYSNGDTTRLAIDGRRVRGVRSVPAPMRIVLAQRRRWMLQPVDQTLDRDGFDSGIVTLLSAAMAFRPGLVITIPIVTHSSGVSDVTVLAVIGREKVQVGGSRVDAWKVEQRRAGERTLSATWYLMDSPPYVAAGEVVVPGGQIMRLTRVLR